MGNHLKDDKLHAPIPGQTALPALPGEPADWVGLPAEQARPPLPRPVPGPDTPMDVATYLGPFGGEHLVVERDRLEAMPPGWQKRLVALLDQVDETFAHRPNPDYKVITGSWQYLNDMTAAQMEQAGVQIRVDSDGDSRYYLDGQELAIDVQVFVPDPVHALHYRQAWRPSRAVLKESA